LRPLRTGTGAQGLLADVASRLAGVASPPTGPDTPVVLVMDGFGPEYGWALTEFVTHLLKQVGPALRVVVTARGDPPIPLHRYALAGGLTEIHADDLSFSEREISAVLAQHGVRLGSASLHGLHERTGGWAAGVRLAAMSMESHPEPEAFAEQFGGDDHAVAGYLMEEVLDTQPAEARRLLLCTSVVDRFDAELATELAGEEAGAHFVPLVRQNAFVMPLGHGWYHYQPMIRDALRFVLHNTSPTEVAGLHRRAATWFDLAGHPTEAVQQTVHAGDWRHATRMVVDRLAIGRVLGLRPADPLAGLFDGMPRDLVFGASGPEPALVAAAAGAASGDEHAS
ncbi:hypothetical protein, partial [Nonomuraea lactucae]|uniref:hypothetical protein n=1 Tax=Nonomuraea lactucae TaxID=2249762 RepID=UPI0019666679